LRGVGIRLVSAAVSPDERAPQCRPTPQGSPRGQVRLLRWRPQRSRRRLLRGAATSAGRPVRSARSWFAPVHRATAGGAVGLATLPAGAVPWRRSAGATRSGSPAESFSGERQGGDRGGDTPRVPDQVGLQHSLSALARTSPRTAGAPS